MLALTMGDPAGIGGELTVQLWGTGVPPFLVLDDPARLRRLRAIPIAEIATAAQARAAWPHALPVLPIPLAVESHPGRPDPRNAPAVIASIRRATALAQAGEVDAVVTNPIAKSVLYGAGFAFPGHTEFVASLTGTPFPVMMLAAPQLRVVPVSIHISLRQAIATLSTDRIVRTAHILATALRQDFGIAQPRIAVAGLNPHAGENGALGDEESTLIAPAIAQLRSAGLAVTGPWPPDSLFTEAARQTYDAALGMYHDQVLIPLKTLDRDHGVNVTLGLPIVRTSPDHGTAFDIAGTGRANPSSLRAALEMAHAIAATRKQTPP